MVVIGSITPFTGIFSWKTPSFTSEMVIRSVLTFNLEFPLVETKTKIINNSIKVPPMIIRILEALNLFFLIGISILYKEFTCFVLLQPCHKVNLLIIRRLHNLEQLLLYEIGTTGVRL